MTVTPRDLTVLAAVARYYTLTRTQLTALCFPDDAGGRVTRKRLDRLVSAGLLNRTRMAVVDPAMGAPQSVYYPAVKGCEYLSAVAGDARPLPPPPPDESMDRFVRRVGNYVAKLDPAVSGRGGHNACFRAACKIVALVGGDVDWAWHFLGRYSATCEPPWSEGELRHKLADALKAHAAGR